MDGDDKVQVPGCSNEQICDQKAGNLNFGPNFFYEVNKDYKFYANNWFVQLDLLCEDPNLVASTSSSYFVGFSAGILLFTLPDQLGRKTTMTLVMLTYMLASFLTIYSP